MARPKGSKNKARTVKASVDYVAVIAEKAAKKEKIESEVATLTANLDDLKTQLKAKKAECCNFFSVSNVSKLKWHIIFLFHKSLPFSDRRLLL